MSGLNFFSRANIPKRKQRLSPESINAKLEELRRLHDQKEIKYTAEKAEQLFTKRNDR